jgi:hypothetical protein
MVEAEAEITILVTTRCGACFQRLTYIKWLEWATASCARWEEIRPERTCRDELLQAYLIHTSHSSVAFSHRSVRYCAE